ncbi:MAG: 3-oxoacyl-ACP reductase FabG [Beijerinckiaceae bacterium]|jgi:NAD(P)-dependent dehydrogenase (short-subunit alcohol dehydrogenase family)|nr:3-oxoacyl-ACP reductase FabG [Beijerinckiaceae bacterium]
MGRLSGKIAIVTGAAQGIGASYAISLAAEGAKVLVSDLLDPAETIAAIKKAGGEAIGSITDVSSPESVAAMVAKCAEAYGSVDILVNNAAIFGKLTDKFFADIDSTEWDSVMAVNVRGVFECVKAVYPLMKENNYGKIINIASGTVFKGAPNLLHYVTSKGAIIAMTRSLSRELGQYNICVNALAPGLTMSENVIAGSNYNADKLDANRSTRALKRLQEPQDLVGAVLFLASADSDFMTGQTMVVDGGSVMH